MGFWDELKKVFGGATEPPKADETEEPARLPVERAVLAAVSRRAKAREMFVPMNVVDEVRQAHPELTIQEALAALETFFRAGKLEPLGYVRTNYVYHPKGTDASTYTSSPPPRPRSAPPPPRIPPAAAVPVVARPTSAAAAPSAPAVDPYQANEILGLSSEELRKRALKIVPWRTAWIGRVDTIPPESDERTAIIDRGLVLRGLLTPEEIQEIHRVGDQWIRHHDAIQLAAAAAHKTVERALEAERDAKAKKKEQKKREAAARKAAHVEGVARRRAEDIVYLGRGVSSKLNDRRANVEQLQQKGLPVLASPADVARALGITIPRLRWLCFHAEAAEKTHYVYFEVPKRSGGVRLLAAPHKQLGLAQRWIFENVLQKLEVTPEAHGFVRGRSTVTNAKMHLGRKLVVNLDLTDFFPTITFSRVRGLFESVGYSPSAATVLALLCTEAPRTKVEHDGKKYWVAVRDRALPQGACTSPALSNQIARKLDRRLDGAARKLGWQYTRYADDLTFSTDDAGKVTMGLFLARVRHIVQDEGFRVNEKKGRVQRAASRQEVTGIVVNQKPSLPRAELRRLRAILHAAKKTGLAAQNRADPSFEARLRGKIGYLMMIDPDKGRALHAQMASLPP